MFAALKVKVLGWRGGIGQQADRIEEGFRAEGCQVVDLFAECDFCFVNDSGHYAEAIAAKESGELKGKLVLGVLDLCPHCQPPLDLARIKEQLSHANAITTISQIVQRDIRARLGVEATVIYNPIRGVAYARGPQLHTALFVGRVQDGEKRASIGAAALSILGYGWNDMVTVGRERPHYGGQYYGEATDGELSSLYNASTFLMCPTRNAFLGLPILEAMACGCIPVVCNDLDVKEEFLPSSVFPEYNDCAPNAPSIARFVARFMGEDGAARKAEFSQRVHNHYLREWSSHLSPAGVARAILNVHQTLV